jgi:hypothetical protein
MGEILAVGITYYPPLTGRDESMTWILKRMMQNPRLPEQLRTAENWPAPMRAEWGADDGAATAKILSESPWRCCLTGALAQLKRRPDETEFVDTWIVNSSKCFLVARPRLENP